MGRASEGYGPPGEQERKMIYNDFDDVSDADNVSEDLVFKNDPPPKPCVLCGTRPQSIGLHCNLCYMDLADQDAEPEY